MVVRNALYRMSATLGGSVATLAVGLLALGVVVLPSAASADPTDCLIRQFESGDIGRQNDSTLGNFLYRIDTFSLDSCSTAEIDGLSIVLKNPFAIPGPNDLDGTTFPALSAQMETDFPDFGHWGGWNITPNPGFELNSTAGFQAASVCIFPSASSSDLDANLAACLGGSATVLPMTDVGGMGMVFSVNLFDGESGLFLCGECDDPLQIAVIAYSDVFGTTTGVVSHPEAVIGYQFVNLVPEPSLAALLLPVFGAWAWRRRTARL